ncbi:unnamed protein product [Diatraea saccharalis]|uniref:Uncharacterized protein n=1 Tax=Diatraea saccharalis TaxID=40085 RepID=A0A9N9WDN5_9NEOP|nr:unnamed protein product [Diatraea saccharalis]
MASKCRTFLLVLVLVNTISVNLSDSELVQHYNEEDNSKYNDKEHEEPISNADNYADDRQHPNYDQDSDYVKATTIEEYTTTEAAGDDNFRSDDTVKNDEESAEASHSIATADVTETVIATVSNVEDKVYKHSQDVEEDIYPGENYNGRLETTPQPAGITVDAEDFVPRIAVLEDDLDIQGQRNPKTDKSESNPNEQRNFDTKPRPDQAVSKSATLKSWLEDSWIRPPAGLLVPLRPMALNRALAVWNDLTVGGLNVSDIVIIGYDSNGESTQFLMLHLLH